MLFLNKKISFTFFLMLLHCFSACEKQTTPLQSSPTAISLKLVDVAVTEAWLQLRVENSDPDYRVTVYRDTIEIYDQPAIMDTLLYDDNLLPSKNYTYRAALWKKDSRIAESNVMTAATMETTSHFFTWRVDTIGTHSSVLNVVVIINENDIWAVGEIHTPETDKYDSLGNWIPPFNAAHWDGNEWALTRFYFYTICGQSSLTPYPAQSIFSYDENDIWIAMDGSQITRLNGSSQDGIFCSPIASSIESIWGNTGNILYIGGTAGSIIKYSNNNWLPITTGKDVNYYDIYGAINDNTGETEIYIVGSLFVLGRELSLLYVNPAGLFSEVDITGLPLSMKSVWFEPGRCVYVAGEGLYRKRLLGKQVWEEVSQDHPNYYKESIRGNGINDVFVAGHTGQISHFNGISWYHYGGRELPQFYGFYTSIAVKGNTVVGVGVFSGARGIISHGIRN